MRFAVIGSPVAHSKSPAMHEAAYRALALPHTYERLETSAEELPLRIDALRRSELDGINVTVPHKSAVLPLVDEVARTAHVIGAANTLVRDANGLIVAHNTDAPALVEELTALARSREEFAGKTAIVIGSGGAARSAISALDELGFARVIVRSRSEHDLGGIATWEPLAAAERSQPKDLAAIVQCTTAGMHGGAPGEIAALAIDWDVVPPGCIAYDVVYAPPRTPFLETAAAHGLPNANGLGMLVAQGALAFKLWLGVDPPREVMRAAIM